jgi:hypothetical protein
LQKNCSRTRVARFFSVQNTKTGKNIQNGHKIYQDFPQQDPPKFTQIGIFGLKTNHLATLSRTVFENDGSLDLSLPMSADDLP